MFTNVLRTVGLLALVLGLSAHSSLLVSAAETPSQNYHVRNVPTYTRTGEAVAKPLYLDKSRPSQRSIKADAFRMTQSSSSSSSRFGVSSSSSLSVMSASMSSSSSSLSSSSSSSSRSSYSRSSRSARSQAMSAPAKPKVITPRVPAQSDTIIERLACKVQANLRGTDPSDATWSRIAVRVSMRGDLTPAETLYVLEHQRCRRLPPTQTGNASSATSTSSRGATQTTSSQAQATDSVSSTATSTSSRRPNVAAVSSKPTKQPLPAYTNAFNMEQLTLLCRVQRRAEASGEDSESLQASFSETLAERWKLDVQKVRSALADKGLCAMTGEMDAAGRDEPKPPKDEKPLTDDELGHLMDPHHAEKNKKWIYAVIAGALILPPLLVLLLPKSSESTKKKK